MDEIKFIVARLNEAPFEKNTTLVELDNLSPVDLLQLVNDIFGELDPVQKKNVRDEDEQDRSQRMLEFTLVLNYKHGLSQEAFIAQFTKGSSTVLHPLLFWLLSNLKKVKLRAYLAKYLRDIPHIPEEFYTDNTFGPQWENFQRLQAEFRTIHKEVTGLRKTAMKPKALSKEMQQLQTEREQLIARLKKIKNRVYEGESKIEDFDQVLVSTQNLRKAQEEESNLANTLQDVKKRLIRAEGRKAKLMKQLRSLEKAQNSHTSVQQSFKRLAREVQDQRVYLNETLDTQHGEHTKKFTELERTTLSEPITLDELDDLEQNVNALQNQIRHLTELREKQLSTSEVKRMQRYYAAKESEREELQEQLEQAEEDARDYEDDLRLLENDLNSLQADSTEVKSEAEIRAFMDDIKLKSQRWMKCQSTMSNGKSELEVLNNTKHILEAQAEDLEAFNEKLEKEMGVEGFREQRKELDNLAELSEAVNMDKGAALNQMSALSKKTKIMLDKRKVKLAPAITKLGKKRTEHEAIDRAYQKEKREYDSVAVHLETERMDLETDVNSSFQAIQDEESSFHYMQTAGHLTAVRAQLVSLEAELQTDSDQRLNTQFSCYQDMFDRFVSGQEAEAKALRLEKKSVRENHADNVRQRQLYLHLAALMDKKLAVKKDQVRKEKDEYLSGAMDLSEMGVDRIVLE